MSRLLDVAVETPWAITEDYLRVILQVASSRLDGDVSVELPSHVDPETVAAQTGDRLDGTARVAVRDGVAVVPVVGPIFRRANLFTEISGATSLELLSRDFNAAVESDDVRAILLDVDSPGGEANGVSELADMVFEARQQLPVVAFVGDLGASGAYWIASSAAEVVAADTALLGSIGVRTAFIDTSERDRQEGIRRIEFVSSQSPRKKMDPTEEQGRADIQRVVDNLATVFVDKVARNRGVSSKTVLEDFGEGSVLVGENAVEVGLADRIGTFEGVISELQSRVSETTRPTGITAKERTMADTEEDQERASVEGLDLSAGEVREAFPEAVAEIEAQARDAGREEGAEEERERIQAIHDLDVPESYSDLLAEGMFDPDATADSVSRRILTAQAEKREASLEARRRDEEELEAPDAEAGTGDEPTDSPDRAAAFILSAGRSEREAETA